MRHLVHTLLLLPVVHTGCGMDVEVAEENLEHRIRWQQDAESEIQDCYTFKLDNMTAVEVDRLQVKFAEGSHHVHLYRSDEPAESGKWDCFKGIDWKRWSLVVGAQTQAMDWQLPDGVTIPFAPHQQLLAQVHWLNTSDKAQESTIDLSFHTTPYSAEHLGVVFGVNQRVEIAPNQKTRIEAFCQMPQGAKLHAMMGHFHAHGRDYRVIERMPNESTGSEIYFAKDEPGFEFKTFAPARDIKPGAGLQYECGFNNWENFPITWGSDTVRQEHCNMTAYFSPADKISELCLLEPSKLTSILPARETVRPGEDLTIALELAAPEATDIDVSLTSSDDSALQVPATVKILAGQRYVSFTARALRPAQVDVSAYMSGAKLTRTVRVTGLVVSELFYRPGTGSDGNNLQWMEIANTSNVAIDLTGYSIGAGTDSFMQTQVAMPMSIPARGCVVIGGPESVPANHMPPLALVQDFSPNLDFAQNNVAGIGLFSTNVQGMTPTLRPIDVLVYGDENTENRTLRGPDGQIAPVWQGSVPGGSIKRVNGTVWAPSTTPTPGVCEVLNVAQ